MPKQRKHCVFSADKYSTVFNQPKAVNKNCFNIFCRENNRLSGHLPNSYDTLKALKKNNNGTANGWYEQHVTIERVAKWPNDHKQGTV